ncbi:hypothetical protein R9X47_20015 [Wukongibacter baidiensis]|uniref:hypothetical protein n=1 Tax=Wukongibacter baidiensis TaxID=1723361 RepID=UPI003D7FAB61
MNNKIIDILKLGKNSDRCISRYKTIRGGLMSDRKEISRFIPAKLVENKIVFQIGEPGFFVNKDDFQSGFDDILSKLEYSVWFLPIEIQADDDYINKNYNFGNYDKCIKNNDKLDEEQRENLVSMFKKVNDRIHELKKDNFLRLDYLLVEKEFEPKVLIDFKDFDLKIKSKGEANTVLQEYIIEEV